MTGYLNRYRYLDWLIMAVIAILFALWLTHPSEAQTRDYFLFMEDRPVALIVYASHKIVLTGEPVTVCVAQPASAPQNPAPHWCLPISELQTLLKERNKTP